MKYSYTIQIQVDSPVDPNLIQLGTPVWFLNRGIIIPMKVRAIRIDEHGPMYSLQSMPNNPDENIEYLDNMPLNFFNYMLFLSKQDALQALQNYPNRTD